MFRSDSGGHSPFIGSLTRALVECDNDTTARAARVDNKRIIAAPLSLASNPVIILIAVIRANSFETGDNIHDMRSAMDIRKTALERAFELATSGKFAKLSDIARQLGAEGYSINQLEGPQLKKQIMTLIAEATKRRA